MIAHNWEPKVGDKVMCLSTTYSTYELGVLIEVGQVYTVDYVHHGVCEQNFSARFRIGLKGIDTQHLEVPYFRTEDFELYVEQDTHEDAWNRAMGVL